MYERVWTVDELVEVELIRENRTSGGKERELQRCSPFYTKAAKLRGRPTGS